MMNQNEGQSPSIALRICVFIVGILLGFGSVWLLLGGGRSEVEEAARSGDGHQLQLLYLSPSGGQAQLWAYDLDTDTHTQLTDLPGSVSGLSPAPDGTGVALALEADGGSSLWKYNFINDEAILLLDCGSDICGSPAWSQGNVLAFSLDEIEADAPTRVWLLDMAMGGTPILASENAGRSPVWSPDGSRLAVVDDEANVLRILDLQGGRTELVPSAMGVQAEWSPDGDALLFLDLELSYEPLGRIYLVDFTVGTISSIDPEGYDEADFSLPAWSPDGARFAVGVRRSGEGLGRKLILLDFSGEFLGEVADDLEVVYGSAAWSPDGRLLAFQRFVLAAATDGPAIMLWDADNGMRLIRADAFLPAWRP